MSTQAFPESKGRREKPWRSSWEDRDGGCGGGVHGADALGTGDYRRFLGGSLTPDSHLQAFAQGPSLRRVPLARSARGASPPQGGRKRVNTAPRERHGRHCLSGPVGTQSRRISLDWEVSEGSPKR